MKRLNVKSKCIITTSKNERDYIRKNIDYKKLGYSSPTDYILKNKNVVETYAERSKVPINLYKDMLFQVENNPYPTLF